MGEKAALRRAERAWDVCGPWPCSQAVAQHSERHAGVPVDWQSEVVVTVGATEALAAAFLGLLNEGDEVGMLARLPCYC